MDNKYLDINGLDYFKNKFERKLESKMNTVGVVHIINKNELSDNQAYRTAKFDLSKFVETDFGGNYSPDIYIDILSWKYGLFYLKIRPLWSTSKSILLFTASFHMKEGDSSIYINSNGSITPPFKIRKTNTSIELYYASDMLQNSDTIQILSYNVIPNSMVEEYNPKDHILTDWSLQKIDTTSIQLSTFNHYYLGYDSIFSSNDNPNDVQSNGLVPHPTTSEADQGHVLCADGTWKKMESGSNFTAVPITLDPTKYQEAYETQTNPDTSKKTIMFMNLDISSIVATGTNITKIELSMYSPIYGTSRLVIDTMMNSIKNQYCVNEDANGAGFYMDYCLAVAEVENSGFTGRDDTKIESFYTFVIDGDIIKIGISPIIFKLLNGTTPPFPIVTLEDCKVFIQSITDGSTSTDISEIPISYEQSTYTLNSVYGANHNGWIAKNTIFSAYVNYDTRDFQSLHNGLVPAPTKVEVEEGKFLKADGSWGYQHPPIIKCSSIENSENLILTSEGEEILEELLSTPCFNFVIKLHGLSTDTFTATSQFAIAKNDRYIKLYDAATSEAIVVLKGGSYVYVTIIKVSENIYHGMCIRHNYNVEN